MPDSMVERVARALYAVSAEGPFDGWERLSAGWQDNFRQHARAAIEAMREPTKAMVRAAMVARPHHPERDNTLDRHARLAVAIYTGAIDAALEDTSHE